MTEQPAAEQLLERCVELAQVKKAKEITSLALAGLTLIADYFLIMSASNTRQAQAIADEITETLKAEGRPALRIEGYREGRWILIDLGSVVAHIFLDEERAYYDLERLWGDAPRQEY